MKLIKQRSDIAFELLVLVVMCGYRTSRRNLLAFFSSREGEEAASENFARALRLLQSFSLVGCEKPLETDARIVMHPFIREVLWGECARGHERREVWKRMTKAIEIELNRHCTQGRSYEEYMKDMLKERRAESSL